MTVWVWVARVEGRIHCESYTDPDVAESIKHVFELCGYRSTVVEVVV